jgi:hypothetical protein
MRNDKELIRSQSASTLRQMQTVNSTLSGEFIGSLEPLPVSPRADFLVSLFEARREILMALDSGILQSSRFNLDTEDFEFLLAVDVLSREATGGVTASRLQQELGISVATVHRRIRSLFTDKNWLEDPKKSACIQFSDNGTSRWNWLMTDLSTICHSWLPETDLNRQTNHLSIHQKVLLDLRRTIQLKHILRSANSRESFQQQDSTKFQDGADVSSALDLMLAVLRTGRQMSQPCEDLAIRHQLSLNEADILIILALYLSENIDVYSDATNTGSSKDKIGWDSFCHISRYLVHSHQINTSVFSRCVKHLGDGDGNLGLVQVRPWGGRTKAARVTELGYHCAERLWRDYLTMADGVLKFVPDELIGRGVSIHKQIACLAGQLTVNGKPLDNFEKQSFSIQSEDRFDQIHQNIPSTEVSDRSINLSKKDIHIIQSIQQTDGWIPDSRDVWNILPKHPAEGDSLNLSYPKGSFRRRGHTIKEENPKALGRHSYIYKKLRQENDELRNTIDGLIAIINRFRIENRSLERNFSDFEKKRLSDFLGEESSEIST